MTGTKICLLGAAGIEAASGIDVSSFEKVGIIGLCILAVVVLYRDGAKKTEKFEQVLEKTTAMLEQTREVLREVREEISFCRRKNGIEPWDGSERQHVPPK